MNPSPEKGVWFFARLADELGKLRPDIPILVVESRGTECNLVGCGLDLRCNQNIFLMSHTNEPKEIWERTRICLMPSLWMENQPLTAIEAMINGIPVICSNRGGMPETIGEGGFLFDIPEEMTPFSQNLASVESVKPWIKMIIRLWDDDSFYETVAARARIESLRWEPESIGLKAVNFFEQLMQK